MQPAQTGLEFVIFLPLPPEYTDYRHWPAIPVVCESFNKVTGYQWQGLFKPRLQYVMDLYKADNE